MKNGLFFFLEGGCGVGVIGEGGWGLGMGSAIGGI
jgi:hypothetical protein